MGFSFETAFDKWLLKAFQPNVHSGYTYVLLSALVQVHQMLAAQTVSRPSRNSKSPCFDNPHVPPVKARVHP